MTPGSIAGRSAPSRSRSFQRSPSPTRQRWPIGSVASLEAIRRCATLTLHTTLLVGTRSTRSTTSTYCPRQRRFSDDETHWLHPASLRQGVSRMVRRRARDGVRRGSRVLLADAELWVLGPATVPRHRRRAACGGQPLR